MMRQATVLPFQAPLPASRTSAGSRPPSSANILEDLWDGAETLRMNRGDTVFRAREKVAYVYRVRSGRVDIHASTSSKGAAPLYYVGSGEWLIESAFCDAHDSCAYCTTPGELERLPVTRFRYLLQQDGALTMALYRRMSRDLADLRHACQYREATVGTLGERVIAYVTSHSDPVSGVFELPYSLYLWAQELGVAHESLSRALRRLRENGLLERPASRTFMVKRNSVPTHG